MGRMSVGTVIVFALVAALVPVAAQAGTAGKVWNAAADFQVFPNQANPGPDSYGNAGVWSYLHSDATVHDPSHYVPFDHYSVIASNVEQWDTGVPGKPFLVGVERGLHQMLLHPNIGCNFTCFLYAVIGWRSPINGVVNVYGDLHLPPASICASGHGINWSVDKGSSSLVTGTTVLGGAGTFTATIGVKRGDSLYFVVDPGFDTDCDLTFLDLTIADAQPPAATAASAQVTANRIDDRFAGSGIDSNAWFFGTDQPDHIAISEGAGSATFNISQNAAGGFNSGLGTTCLASGDFDARVSINLVQWPLLDGVDVSLQASGTPYNAYRASASWYDSWGAYLPPAGATTPATGTTGALRLTRFGSTWTAYYMADHRWVAIAAGDGPTDDLGMTLAVFNIPDATVFGGQTAIIQFTDFQLTADRIVCP